MSSWTSTVNFNEKSNDCLDIQYREVHDLDDLLLIVPSEDLCRQQVFFN